MYKPLNMFASQTDELKRLIEKYPDYPIDRDSEYDIADAIKTLIDEA